MELQTVRQVSLDYSISNRMLRYYEQIGLIESSRIDDYAYRVYDAANIKRLQHIIILRKLQIPMKQIKDILNNQNAVEVIEIFKQNINELDEQITALTTVKSILARFVNELREKADIHLKFDLLNDKTILAAVNVISFTKNKIEERVSMEDLNKASELLDKEKDKNVRVVYQPPVTMAWMCFNDGDDIKKDRKKVEAILKKFIIDTNLFKIKPDIKFFSREGGYSVTIPDNFDVPLPLIKKPYIGGLCAVFREDEWGFLKRWVENSDLYEWDIERPVLDEFINGFNIYGLKKTDSDTLGCNIESLCPIKEMYDLTEAIEKYSAEMIKSKETVLRGKITEINLRSMKKRGEVDLEYYNGLTVRMPKVHLNNGIETTQSFKLPLKIELRLKTDGEVRIGYAKGDICFNSHDGYTWGLWTCGITNDDYNTYKRRGEIPVEEFVDIEWILDKEITIIKADGEIRYCGVDHDYIKEFKENLEFSLSSSVSVTAVETSMVMVEKFRVTEL